MLLYTWIPFPFSPICSIHHIPEGLISLFQVSQLDHVFALSDLEDETFATLIRVLRLYGECQLKGQKKQESLTLEKGHSMMSGFLTVPHQRSGACVGT